MFFANSLFPQIMLGLPALEGVNPASRFPCSAIGYDASCYSRIWSEVCEPFILGSSQATISFICNHCSAVDLEHFILIVFGSWQWVLIPGIVLVGLHCGYICVKVSW